MMWLNWLLRKLEEKALDMFLAEMWHFLALTKTYF